MAEITIDTNIFEHADNPQESREQAARELVHLILEDRDIILCVDSGFDLNPSENESRIGWEYINRLRGNTLGYYVLDWMGRQGRIEPMECDPDQYERQTVRSLISSSGADQKFVLVTLETSTGVMASHDYQDFPTEVRERLKSKLNVHVLDAEQARVRIEKVS